MTPNPPHKASGGASSSAYGSEVGGGWRQAGRQAGREMSETKREEIALKAVDLSELNQRRPAARSDSASPLNITD